jgi:hypothetical protein
VATPGHEPPVASPVERGPRIGLAAWGDVLVTDDRGDWITAHQCPGESSEARILAGLVRGGIGSFELDADREIVAALAVAPPRLAGVPGSTSAGHELDQRSIALDQEVCRNARGGDGRVIGMLSRVEAIGEKLDDPRASEMSRRQRDVVNDEKADLSVGRPLVAVGRGDLPGRAGDAGAIDGDPRRRSAVLSVRFRQFPSMLRGIDRPRSTVEIEPVSR